MTATEKVNILMVDDQPAKLLTYESILGELGENLIRAASAKEALEHLLRTEVAVLLVDVNMPDVDGFELARIVREHPRFERTAIIFISAVHLTDLDRLKGYQLGAVDYVPVPVVPEILRAKVGVFVELYRQTRQLESMNFELEIRVAERTAALAASEERFRLATEAMRGGLYDWDLQTDQVFRSVGMQTLIGYSPEQQDSSSDWWLRRIHPDDLAGPWKEALLARSSGLPAFDVQYRVRHQDGNWVWVWDRGRIVRDEKGEAVRIVGHRTDISAQKSAEDALKEADRRKDEFLAMLSHELRNPLAPIRNALNAMRTGIAPGLEPQESWEVIDRQVTHLTRLVDDLLDVSRISRNELQLHRSGFNLAEAVNAAIEASTPLLDQRGLHFNVSLPAEPVYVDGDLIRLTQVFTNLLNNSAKYTPRGGQVWLTAEMQSESVAVRVRDSGIGIPADKLPRVFQMFYQGNGHRPHPEGGFGIGLTLVARIVQLHGGTVEAHSAGPNTGSEFIVRLPVLSKDAAMPQGQDRDFQHSNTDARKSAASMRRVLVVDDNVDSAESLALLLKLQGHDIRIAHDGLEAVRIASEFFPDAVLLDIGIPGMNGYDVARRMRQQPWGQNILIIAQTGWGQEKDRDSSREAGCDAHLTKPVDYDVLIKLLAASAGKEEPVRS